MCFDFHFFTGVYIQKKWSSIARRECFKNGYLFELVNVALGVTGEFLRLGITEFGFSGVTVGVAEFLAKYICGINKTATLYKIYWTFCTFLKFCPFTQFQCWSGVKKCFNWNKFVFYNIKSGERGLLLKKIGMYSKITQIFKSSKYHVRSCS